MSDQVGRNQILGFTERHTGAVVAECIAELDCVVYAEGKELPAWASRSVTEKLPSYATCHDAIITTETAFEYWLLSWDGLRTFQQVKGPMTASEFQVFLDGKA